MATSSPLASPISMRDSGILATSTACGTRLTASVRFCTKVRLALKVPERGLPLASLMLRM